jgi:uncharacterized protein affecting Mg2+/Co2+ transport
MRRHTMLIGVVTPNAIKISLVLVFVDNQIPRDDRLVAVYGYLIVIETSSRLGQHRVTASWRGCDAAGAIVRTTASGRVTTRAPRHIHQFPIDLLSTPIGTRFQVTFADSDGAQEQGSCVLVHQRRLILRRPPTNFR